MTIKKLDGIKFWLYIYNLHNNPWKNGPHIPGYELTLIFLMIIMFWLIVSNTNFDITRKMSVPWDSFVFVTTSMTSEFTLSIKFPIKSESLLIIKIAQTVDYLTHSCSQKVTTPWYHMTRTHESRMDCIGATHNSQW